MFSPTSEIRRGIPGFWLKDGKTRGVAWRKARDQLAKWEN